MINREIRYCLVCDSELEGRSDKKFCSKEHSNFYHNNRRHFKKSSKKSNKIDFEFVQTYASIYYIFESIADKDDLFIRLDKDFLSLMGVNYMSIEHEFLNREEKLWIFFDFILIEFKDYFVLAKT